MILDQSDVFESNVKYSLEGNRVIMSSTFIAMTILKPAVCGVGDARILATAPLNDERHTGRLPRVRRS